MRDRAILVIAYFAIVATIVAGTLAVSWWAAVACAAILALISLTASFGSHSRYALAGSIISPPTVYASTAINAVSAAVTAYVLGRIIAWLLGV
jgi:hypothetical protein